MTTISETAPTVAQNRPHAGIWHRATHALGKLWAKMVASLEAPAAARRGGATGSLAVPTVLALATPCNTRRTN
jgi:hypothetical protein